MKTVLFQGDSITDCGRDKKNPDALGPGYPDFVAGYLGMEHPGEYRFINRGISGNRSIDIFARVKADIINLKPDYLSFLFGVNDVWHEICWQNGVDIEKYEQLYRMMLDEIYKALPNIKIVLLEPYVLLGTATENTEEIPDKWERFSKEVPLYAKVVDRIAEDYHIPVIKLYDRFNEVYRESGSSDHWTRDGVHPNPAGHELIAREWIKNFNILSKQV